MRSTSRENPLLNLLYRDDLVVGRTHGFRLPQTLVDIRCESGPVLR